MCDVQVLTLPDLEQGLELAFFYLPGENCHAVGYSWVDLLQVHLLKVFHFVQNHLIFMEVGTGNWVSQVSELTTWL